MIYDGKTDWLPDDTVYPADTNRIETGITDAAAQINTIQTEVDDMANKIGAPADAASNAPQSLFSGLKWLISRFTSYWTDARAAKLDNIDGKASQTSVDALMAQVSGINFSQIPGTVKRTQAFSGATAAGGSIAVQAVDRTRPYYILCYGKGSAGSVAVGGGTFRTSTNFSNDSGGGASNVTAMHMGSDDYGRSSIIEGTFTGGGTTNLTAGQYTAWLTSDTNLQYDGPCQGYIVEYW
jgi:hypothetical protein